MSINGDHNNRRLYIIFSLTVHIETSHTQLLLIFWLSRTIITNFPFPPFFFSPNKTPKLTHATIKTTFPLFTQILVQKPPLPCLSTPPPPPQPPHHDPSRRSLSRRCSSTTTITLPSNKPSQFAPQTPTSSTPLRPKASEPPIKARSRRLP